MQIGAVFPSFQGQKVTVDGGGIRASSIEVCSFGYATGHLHIYRFLELKKIVDTVCACVHCSHG